MQKNFNKTIFINELNQLMTKIKAENQDCAFIIAGDFNARRTEWGDHADNERGKYLRKWEYSEAKY